MELLIKAAVAAIVGSLVALLVRRSNPELSLLLTLAVSLGAVAVALKMSDGVMEVVSLAQEYTGMSAAVTAPVLKCVGIGVISKLTGDLCRDAGQSAAASSVELAGAVSAVYVALPLIRTLLQTLGELI